jgi:hypothetical protein
MSIPKIGAYSPQMPCRSGFAAVMLLLALGGCGGDSPEDESDPVLSAYAHLPEGCPAPADPAPHEYDAELHDELLAMLERDQSGRTGGPDEEGDEVRTERLKEIVAQHGWPGFDLVGEDGEDAAWAIAQHSDLDPEFQRCALALLEIAVADEQGSPGNLAYLSDRVAVAAGEPQRYGTQVGCTADGKPNPATPLSEPDRIDELRAEADLPPYDEYLEEMEQICSGD